MKLTEKQLEYSTYTAGAIVAVGGTALAFAGMNKLRDQQKKADFFYGCVMTGVGLGLAIGGVMFISAMREEFSE